MNKYEYFSNIYKVIIKSTFLHIIFSLLEYLFTLIAQLIIFLTDFNSKEEINYSRINFFLNIIKFISLIPTSIKLIVIIIIYMLVLLYFFIYQKYTFKNIKLCL